MSRRIICLLSIAIFCMQITSCIKPYQAPIEQGNILNTQTVNKIHNGMSSQQVTSMIGKPVLTNLYNNQLTYVYTFQEKIDSRLLKKRLRITFMDNKITHIDKNLSL
ncbi:MAG: hypothetical protein CL816_06625 [Coxiellaceae bacterium]|nr:hypothetical protein [Coxiellaceae bacterium]